MSLSSSAVQALERALRWALAHPELTLSLVVTLLGGTEALRQYRRTGRIPYRTLPWRAIRRLVYAARRRWFRYPKPQGETETVAIPISTVRERLGAQSYEPAWPLSLHYSGEDLNCRRYVLRPDTDLPHRQVHIRAWDRGGMTELYAHEEPSAIHHPKAHVQSSDMTDATQWVYERVHHPSGLDPRGFYKPESP